MILELKSTEKQNPVYAKQLKTYLALTGKKVGLVLNFGMETMLKGVEMNAPPKKNLCASVSLCDEKGY